MFQLAALKNKGPLKFAEHLNHHTTPFDETMHPYFALPKEGLGQKALQWPGKWYYF